MRFFQRLSKRQKYAILIIFLLSGGILLSSFHYHEDGAILDDCPVCRFQDSGVAATSVDMADSVEPASIVDQEFFSDPVIAVTVSTRPFETLPNAPPALS
ncbi:MAG TPA: hypothetical protein PKY31_04515 [Spirochaetota bacterium]|nr:hypothetical protein [Spirochaetota bacterium]